MAFKLGKEDVFLHNDTGSFQTVFEVNGELRRLGFKTRKQQSKLETTRKGLTASRYKGRVDLPPGYVDEALSAKLTAVSRIPALRREEWFNRLTMRQFATYAVHYLLGHRVISLETLRALVASATPDDVNLLLLANALLQDKRALTSLRETVGSCQSDILRAAIGNPVTFQIAALCYRRLPMTHFALGRNHHWRDDVVERVNFAEQSIQQEAAGRSVFMKTFQTPTLWCLIMKAERRTREDKAALISLPSILFNRIEGRDNDWELTKWNTQ